MAKALDHWTGVERMTPEQAEELQENRRAMYVLQRLQILQFVCRQAGVSVPLQTMRDRRSSLSDECIVQLFGDNAFASKETPSSPFSPPLSSTPPSPPRPHIPQSDEGPLGFCVSLEFMFLVVIAVMIVLHSLNIGRIMLYSNSIF